ncbi:MAG: ester cyclase [Nitrososphaera sp.]
MIIIIGQLLEEGKTYAMGELTQLITQHYRNVSEGHIERDREIMSDDITHISATAATVRGIEAFLVFVTLFKQAFPYLQCEIRDFIEGSYTLVAEGVFIGTNTDTMVGPRGPITATGRRVELPFCDIWKVSNGRIVENRIYYDEVTFLSQLGLMTSP